MDVDEEPPWVGRFAPVTPLREHRPCSGGGHMTSGRPKAQDTHHVAGLTLWGVRRDSEVKHAHSESGALGPTWDPTPHLAPVLVRRCCL